MEPRQLRDAFGHFPTGVAIVTTLSDGGPVGMTVSSFNTVSLDPPLVLFSLDRRSLGLPAFAAASRIGINVLAEGQDVLSSRFAARGGDKWAGTAWRPGAEGCPLIDGALVGFECALHGAHDGGDHLILVCRVLRAEVVGSDEPPLLFWRGGYRSLADLAA
ncbi:flavin reductase family protein [Roseomonas populi]|uniref:Flavin reductase family protein n=1 Tax=Roseomonas populi TaxID=3121582 RepID=A0ABT1X7Q7_9PROT|nr:flavin reductase family protein [Roseomonas pecuniae]MCR0983776.1 flavin reductase family protein [Roseomonas pecuniae]